MNRFFSELSRSYLTLTLTILISIGFSLILYFGNSYWTYPSMQEYNILWNLIRPLTNQYSWTFWVNFAVIMLCSRLIYKFNEFFSLSTNRTILPFLFFVMLFINNTAINYFSESTFALPLIIMSLFALCESYGKEKSSGYAFITGIGLGILALFWTRALFYFPVFLLGLIFVRSSNFKSFIAIILGTASVLWCQYAVIFLLYDSETFFLQFNELAQFRVPDIFNLPLTAMAYSVLTFLFGGFSIISQMIRSKYEKIRTKSYNSLLIFIAVVSIALSVFNPSSPAGDIAINNICIALLATTAFNEVKTKTGTIMFFISIILFTALFVCGVMFPDLTLLNLN